MTQSSHAALAPPSLLTVPAFCQKDAVGTYVGAAVSSLGLGFAERFGWRAACVVSGLAGLWGSWLLHRTSVGGEERGKDLNRMLACGGRNPWAALAPWDIDADGKDGSLSAGGKAGGGVGGGGSADLGSERIGLLSGLDSGAGPGGGGAAALTEPNPFLDDDGGDSGDSGAVAAVAAAADLANGGSSGGKGSLVGALKAVRSSNRLLLLFGATSCRMAATFAAAAYLPVYFTRAYPESSAHFGRAHAAAILLGGGTSCYAGGRMADAWAPSHPPALAWLPAAGGAVAVVPLLLALRAAGGFGASVGWLGAGYLCAECWLGPGMTLLQLLMRDRPHLMSTTVALLLCANTLVASAAPYAIASGDDGTAGSARALLGWTMGLAYAASAVLFAALARTLAAHGSVLPASGPPGPPASSSIPFLSAASICAGEAAFTYTVPSLAAPEEPPASPAPASSAKGSAKGSATGPARAFGTTLGGGSPRSGGVASPASQRKAPCP